MNLKTTHIGKKTQPADNRFEAGPVLAHVDGNRVVLTRRTTLGEYPIISDAVIPDELLPMVLADLDPV